MSCSHALSWSPTSFHPLCLWESELLHDSCRLMGHYNFLSLHELMQPLLSKHLQVHVRWKCVIFSGVFHWPNWRLESLNETEVHQQTGNAKASVSKLDKYIKESDYWNTVTSVCDAACSVRPLWIVCKYRWRNLTAFFFFSCLLCTSYLFVPWPQLQQHQEHKFCNAYPFLSPRNPVIINTNADQWLQAESTLRIGVWFNFYFDFE